MSYLLDQHLPHVQAISVSEAALVFRKVYNVCEVLAYLHTFLEMVDHSNNDLDSTALPGMISQTSQMLDDLYDAYVLLCPEIDAGHAESQLIEAGIRPKQRPGSIPLNPNFFPKEQ